MLVPLRAAKSVRGGERMKRFLYFFGVFSISVLVIILVSGCSLFGPQYDLTIESFERVTNSSGDDTGLSLVFANKGSKEVTASYAVLFSDDDNISAEEDEKAYVGEITVEGKGSVTEEVAFEGDIDSFVEVNDSDVYKGSAYYVMTVVDFYEEVDEDDESNNTAELDESISFLNVTTKGLIAEYLFGGDADDTSGNDNHGTVNGATLSKDRFGKSKKAYSFDGDDTISVDASSDSFQNITDAISLSVFLKIDEWDNPSGDDRWFPIMEDAAGSDQSFRFHLQAGNDTSTHNVEFKTSRYEGIKADYNSGFNKDEWYHIGVAFDHDTTEVTVFVNGEVIENDITGGSNLPNMFTSDLLFGKAPFGMTEFTIGKLDDIRIYKRVLSTQEMRELYHEGGLDW